ncbi:TonB-dependent receptor [Colwellia sp. 4_MG-2023]|uniref:TonB-dependent receptor n=1 Tax=unclassified Colwellia TaxID=196834 RepID=UPI001C087B69|nr:MULTISPECIES: TonB-dependent receptor [unclassified Colwellia]MBU2924341.1 TonB-dependent receptor [Colwellia sp. C2M11]MDO6505436.1 TonB-dependent receptor [Colwellia sp. 5_MG-2023]MDO6554268.1 TonB-dependent receptor [Colwellia sp. 4_MG-2023]MDO6650857.1 TonB-dependent receptor [Colwellia sp. 3_MG-2023]MDO6663892.1 TonB-dependent receptor [Colwellia sp. 2_MG-2023]
MKLTKLHAAVLTAIAASGSLYAEEVKTQEKSKIEVIEVTSTKRAESIQEVPVTVTALTGDSLEKLGVSNFDQYVEFLPNVVFQGTGPGQNEIYIRGAATTQTNISVSSVQALQPSVAFYLDEQPVSMQGRNLDVYASDVERVEVLPGPQGTLFGASSQSGTVRIITNKPSHDGFSAGFDTSTGSTSGGDMSNSVEAYFNMSLTDSLAIRVATYNDHQGGWIDNILNTPGEGGYTGSAEVISRISGGVLTNPQDVPVIAPQNAALVEDDFNTADYAGARFGLSYIINDEWNLLVQHTQQSLDTEGVFAYDPNLEGETSTNRFIPENNNDDFGLTTWTLEGRLQNLDIVYTGGYLDRDINSTIDYTGYTNGGSFSAYYVCNYAGIVESEQECLDPTKYYKEETSTSRITHELRFSTAAENRWRVTAGVFYDSQELSTVGQFKIASTDKFPDMARTLAGSEGTNSNGGPFPSEVSFVNDVTHTIDQIAVFGQLEFDITDTVTASFGARWYQIDDIYKGATTGDDVSGRLRAFGDGSDEALTEFFGAEEAAAIQAAIASGQLDTSLLDDDGTLTVDDTIIKASIDWKISDEVMVFASYSEGFRPPVTNRVGGGAATSQEGAFDGFRIPVYSTTDSLDNFEIGFKSTLFDQSLRFNATAYYSEISDLQTSRYDPTNISFLVFTDNVGEAEIRGIDGDFTWAATDNLIISGAFSFIDSELTSVNSQLAGIAPAVGSQLPYSAEFSGNLQAQYFYSIANDMTGYINGSISYTGDRLAGMSMDAYVVEDATNLIYGTGSGLSIQKEADVFSGVNYQDRNGETFAGGRYIQDSYVLANLSFGVTNDEWKAEIFIDNVTDESAVLYIDTQQFTPKVVSNRPRTIGFRFSYDFY